MEKPKLIFIQLNRKGNFLLKKKAKGRRERYKKNKKYPANIKMMLTSIPNPRHLVADDRDQAIDDQARINIRFDIAMDREEQKESN